VTCPSCQTRYQLQPSLRGQSIRCPNTACRAVFVVQEASEGAPTLPAPARPSAGKAHHAGSVGDLVPILPAAEADDDVPELESANNLVTNAVPLVRGELIRPEKPEVAAPAWQQSPPPVRRGPQGRAAPPELPSAPKTERRSRPVPPPA